MELHYCINCLVLLFAFKFLTVQKVTFEYVFLVRFYWLQHVSFDSCSFWIHDENSPRQISCLLAIVKQIQKPSSYNTTMIEIKWFIQRIMLSAPSVPGGIPLNDIIIISSYQGIIPLKFWISRDTLQCHIAMQAAIKHMEEVNGNFNFVMLPTGSIQISGELPYTYALYFWR